MALSLSIESTGLLATIAIHKNGELLAASTTSQSGGSHSKWLAPMVQECFNRLGLKASQLNYIAISEGPGSFTGLRISGAFALGLAMPFQLPILPVNTLKLLAFQAQNFLPESIIIPMIDARRSEVYTAAYGQNLQEIMPPQALIFSSDSYYELLELQNGPNFCFIGSGASKWKNYCLEAKKFASAQFLGQIHPSAEALGVLAYQIFQNQAEDAIMPAALWQPFYLKPSAALPISQQNKAGK